MLFETRLRRLTAIVLLLGGLIGIVAMRKCTPDTVKVDMNSTEMALGMAIGSWLKSEGCREVVILDTDWEVPHLKALAEARAAGFAKSLGNLPYRVILARGPGERQEAWQRALTQCSAGTGLVSCFGVPGKATLPTQGQRLVLVGEADGTGLPRKPALTMPLRTIKPRLAPTAPVWKPDWKGSDEERFAAFYQISDLPATIKER